MDALKGHFKKEYIFALKQDLALFDFGNAQLDECDREIMDELETYPTATDTPPPERDKDKNKPKRYSTSRKPNRNDVPFEIRRTLWEKSGRDFTALSGVEANTALLIFAELGGADVSSWASVKEFSSWLKLSQGNNISGGKRRKSKKQILRQLHCSGFTDGSIVCEKI